MTVPSPFQQPPSKLPPPPPPQPQVPHYQTAFVAPTVVNVHAHPQEANSLGSAALVVGIIALVFSFIPIIGMVSWVLAPLAIIFGAIGAFRPVGKGKSHAGWIMGVIALIVCILWVVALNDLDNDDDIDSRPQVHLELR